MRRIVYLVFFLFLLSCQSYDSWYTGVQADLSYESFTEGISIDYFFVNDSMLNEILHLLETTEFILLNDMHLEDFTGIEMEKNSQYYYLVRSLYFYNNPGGYDVRQVNNSVIISHNSLGGRGTSMKRGAIIIGTETHVESIYIECSLAR